MAEWSIAKDCKSFLNSAVVRIHLSPPYNCFVSIAGLMRYPVTVEIRGSNPLRGAKFMRWIDIAIGVDRSMVDRFDSC